MIPELETLESFEGLVIDWADDRRILSKSMPGDQWGKAYEEMGELFRAIRASDQAATCDGIGDVLVCLIILANMCNLDLRTCLCAAWIEIRDRKGTMVNGLFVKENDHD